MKNNELQQILDKISELEPQAVELMKNLVGINSVGPANDGPGEKEKADYITNYLRVNGFKDINDYPAPDERVAGKERPNLVALVEGKNPDQTFWILSHTDIVPAGDLSKWDTDPFTAVVTDGKIYGRGSEDNQQGLVSSLMMARAFLETGLKPDMNIGLIFMADEETGSEYGLTYLLKHHGDMFKKNDVIVIPDAGLPDSTMIEVAEKSILWLKFKTTGKQVHASTPEFGINAFRAASNLVVRLQELHQIYDAADAVFSPAISTFEPTKKEANVPNINTIPGDDIFCLDCRILPVYDIADVMRSVREIADKIETEFKVKIEISSEQKEQAAPATSVDAPVVRKLQEAIKAVYGVNATPQGIGGGTVAAIFRRQNFPVAVWSTLDDLAHQPNEYCKIENLINDAKVFARCTISAGD
ncbi:MAG: M20 family metallo-hydrolase [Calditrichales bacterium]|nr:MAG: M20 family metallo-hydrolase [Calditrichales bacterium]